MPDESDKQPIPARQAQSSTTSSSTAAADVTDAAKTVPDAATATSSTATPVNGETIEHDQREQIQVFLEDPAVKDASVEKKRTFLISKDMPVHLIEEELAKSDEVPAVDKRDLERFSKKDFLPQHDETHAQLPPPIITYPEFLANAHQAQPLVTPARVLATTYVASATAVLAYAASTYLIKPMIASLTDARHDFAEHSNTKIGVLNTKMEQMVTKLPDVKSGKELDSDSSDSDPTELFSQDIGTQTEAAAPVESNKVTISEPTATVNQVQKLKLIQTHLDEILAGAKKEELATAEREDNVKKLRHYLDSLAYGSSGVNVWSNQGGQFGWEQTAADQHKEQEKKNDVIEELKKEIRSVKGVLLSAKRFPPTGRVAPTGARVGAPA